MRKILQQKEDSAILRNTTREVPIKDITSAKVKKILKEMSEALGSQEDGVAIAAPQIGYPLSIFVVSGKVFDQNFLEGRKTRYSGKDAARRSGQEGGPDISAISAVNRSKKFPKDLVFINPKISKLSREKAWVPEGCLSVRWLYGMVQRSKKATITAYDENGKKFTRGASGLLAQIFQHETDHLQGVLFIDKAKEVKEELP